MIDRQTDRQTFRQIDSTVCLHIHYNSYNIYDNLQINLLSNRVKPVFSNLIEQDSGMVTAGNLLGNQGNRSMDDNTDLYNPVYNVPDVKVLLEHGVEEYNKTHPRIKLALYRVSK